MKTLEQAQTLQENVVSSLWIAKVSGKRHDDTLKKIRRHISNPIELKYINKQNKAVTYIELTEEQALKFFKTFVEDDIQLKLINSLRAFKGLELLTELEAEEGEIRNKVIEKGDYLTVFENIEEPLVSHKTLVEYSGNDEHTVLELIRKYKKDLVEIGGGSNLPFQMGTSTHLSNAVNKEKIYFLNEHQATLLLTFMRNTEQVVKFKINLVKEFMKMKDYIKNDVKQLKERLNDLEKENTKLIQEKSIIQQERDIAYREAGIRLNDYDDNFKTLSRLIKENNLEKEFTPHVLNKLLVEQELAEAIERKTDVTVFKFTEYTRHAPPNRETKKASNLVHKDYFIDTLIPLAREKGIRRTSRFIAKAKEGLQETIDKKVTDEITDIVPV